MQSKAESILLAGAVTGIVVSLLELVPAIANCLVCAAYVGSGWLAVWHFTNTYGVTLRPARGAVMGALAGALGAIISSLVDFGLSMLGTKPTFVEQFEDGIEALESGGVGPQQLEQLRELMASPLFLVAAGLIALSVVSLLGAAGGASGAAAVERKAAKRSS